MNALSLFSGGGICETYLKDIGVNVVVAVLDIMPKFAVFENVPEQENTYIKYNNRRTLVP